MSSNNALKREVDSLPSVAMAEARMSLGKLVSRCAYGGERIILKRSGEDVGAVVPIQDIELLLTIEDYVDIENAKAVMKRIKKGAKTYPLEEVERRLGLD